MTIHRRFLGAALLALPAAIAATAAVADAPDTRTAGSRQYFDQVLGRGDGLPYPPVPAAPADEPTAPPRVSYAQIWHPGTYEWDGKGYTWTAGQWIRRPEGFVDGTLWMPGHWKQAAPNSWTYQWVRGHWTPAR